MKLLELNEEKRLEMVKADMPQLNLLATVHNLILLLENRQWERLPNKLWDTKEAYNSAIESLNRKNSTAKVENPTKDELFEPAKKLIIETQQASVSLIQRRFSLGYHRAGKIMDQLEASGVVGPFEGSKTRQVLISIK